MICELCEKEKHCLSLDLEWTLLEHICEDCAMDYLKNGYVDYDQLEKDKEERDRKKDK